MILAIINFQIKQILKLFFRKYNLQIYIMDIYFWKILMEENQKYNGNRLLEKTINYFTE
jgi:hypothetical protein